MSTSCIFTHNFKSKYNKGTTTIHMCVKSVGNFSKIVKLTFVVNKVSDKKDVSVFVKKGIVDTSLYIIHWYV